MTAIATPKPLPDRTSQVWILTSVIAAAAALLVFWLDNPQPVVGTIELRWWALAPLVYVGEVLVVHLRFRQDAHSFSMSEIPLTLGLFLSRPTDLVIAVLVGNAVALFFNRRQPLLKLAFNLGQFSLCAAAATVVFRSISALGDPLGSAGWIGALAGTTTAMLLANGLINFAIRLTGGTLQRSDIQRVLALSGVATIMNTSLALVAAFVFLNVPEIGWLTLIPPTVLFLAYRAYMSQHDERKRVAALYQASRALHESPQLEDAIRVAGRQAIEMFEAEFVEVTLFEDDTLTAAHRSSVGRHHNVVMEPVTLSSAPALWRSIATTGQASVITAADIKDAPTAGEVRDGLIAPLLSGERTIGVMLIANSVGDVSHFNDKDLPLLETLANHLSVSLENARLEDSLVQVTELKEELKHRALHDGLTGLANRSLFIEKARRAAEEAEAASSVAVLFLDLDDFKTVNDSLGHQAGDDLLIAASERIRNQCRPEDVVARLGGDEFAVLLTGMPEPNHAEDVAHRMLTSLSEPYRIADRMVSPRASIGIANGEKGVDAGQLMRNADAAMYVAKRGGKHTYAVFHPTMYDEVLHRLELRTELEQALNGENLDLAYQPIVDLDTGATTALEALLRWSHPVRGEVGPDQFIPFAEETGLIVELGNWVLREACFQAAQLKTGGRPIGMSINLSPRQLADPGFPDHVVDALQVSGLAPERLTLEITEGVLMRTPVHRLADLKDLGVRLSIDDFGTGYSSLSYLDQLPIDQLKIDKSFVARLGDSNSALAPTVLRLGESLGLETVAEGIETKKQWLAVKDLHCSLGQGFFFGHPLPIDEAKLLLGTVLAPPGTNQDNVIELRSAR